MKELELLFLLFALGQHGNKFDQKSINVIAEQAPRGIAWKNFVNYLRFLFTISSPENITSIDPCPNIYTNTNSQC